jgi:hypothetical protein
MTANIGWSARSTIRFDDSKGQPPYQRVDAWAWTAAELVHGQRIKLKGFPQEHKGHLCRVAVSAQRTDSIVTHDGAQDSTAATQEGWGVRWKIEQWPPGKANSSRAWNVAGAARHASRATPSAAPCSSGVDSKNWRPRLAVLSTDSNMACWMTTSFSNSAIPLSRWFLRKS